MRAILAFCAVVFSFNVYAQNVETVETKDKIYPVPKDVNFTIEKTEFTDSELRILKNLEAKRIELERKAQVLLVREKLIDLSEQKLLTKIARLEKLEQSIKELLKDVSKQEEKRLSDLAIVYSEMKPKLAAERLNVLDEITVYEILKRMNFKKAAKILESMKVERVTVISQMLAEKSMLPIVEKK
jgi:flagellar motility protein MotE (MotC chaperone)